MVFENFSKLFHRSNRLNLFLVIWVLTGYICFQFLPTIVGIIIFVPLIFTCLIFLFAALIYRTPVNDLGKKAFILPSILAIITSLLIYSILYSLFLMALLSYIVISAIFTMYNFYKWAIKIDKIIKSGFIRLVLFVGGTIVSLTMIILATNIYSGLIGDEFNLSDFTIVIGFVIVILALLGLIVGKIRKQSTAWLGILFLWVAIYTIFLMVSIYSDLNTENGSTSYDIGITFAIFLFNLFILIYTITGLIGAKAEMIKKKAKVFRIDIIVFWLIFSVATYEFIKGFPDSDIIMQKNIGMFLFFIPLLLIMGIYGLKNYKNN